MEIATQESESDATDGKILIADNNSDYLAMISPWLNQHSYTTEFAKNGREVLEMLRQEPFVLVLLDVMLSGVDGFNTLLAIKADKQLKHIPVIMLSDQTESNNVSQAIDIAACIEVGADDYLVKPFNPVILWARVSSSLEKRYLYEQEKKHIEQNLRTEAKLERQQSLTEMVAGVAHEINTPLGVASTALSIIENRLTLNNVQSLFQEKDEYKELLEDILDALNLLKNNLLRAHRLVETFKKISAGSVVENKEKTNLPDLIAEIVDLFRINAKQAQLSIQIDRSNLRGNPEWFGYQGSLIQVLLNLLQNIERYAYPNTQGGKVNILISDQGENNDNQFRISVRDFGVGISEENQTKIFNPFFTTGRGKGGTGLGLAIVRNLVNTSINGNISVKSAMGEGTEFTITFPKKCVD